MPAAKLKDKAAGGLLERATPSPSTITTASRLVGFQAGPYGFVRLGTNDSPTGWMDYLYQIVYGGRGGGKSQGGALRTLKYVTSHPRAFGIITAPTLNVIHDATLPALQRVFEQAGLYEDRDYSYNNTREEIKLWNGGTILLRSTEHPQRIRGMDAAWFWMDEPRDSPLEAFLNLQATLRQQGFPHQGWMTTTPLGKYHWTYPLFFPEEAAREGMISEVGTRGTGIYVKFFAPTRENPFGGEELYQNLIRTYGVDSPRARQELEGQIVLQEGLVYPTWDARRYVVPESEWPSYPVRVVAGVDFGFAAPAGVIVEGVDKVGRRYLLDQVYKAGLDEAELGGLLIALKRKYGIAYFACDWADPRWIHTLRRRFKLPAVRAMKKVGRTTDPSSGIGLCTKALANDDQGEQMFFVSPKCEDFIVEIENYVRDEPRNLLRNPDERPRKFRDHLMDSWRYAETFIADHYHRPGESPSSLLPTQRVTIKKAELDLKPILDALENDGSNGSPDTELPGDSARTGEE